MVGSARLESTSRSSCPNFVAAILHLTGSINNCSEESNHFLKREGGEQQEEQKQTLIGQRVCARMMGTCHSNPELNKVVKLSGTPPSGVYLPCYQGNIPALWVALYFSTFTLTIILNPSCWHCITRN